jgi:hypothetical protein
VQAAFDAIRAQGYAAGMAEMEGRAMTFLRLVREIFARPLMKGRECDVLDALLAGGSVDEVVLGAAMAAEPPSASLQ